MRVVEVTGLTVPDAVRLGEYQDRVAPPYVLGQELAGVVLEAPTGSGFQAGDRLAGMSGGVGAATERVWVEPGSLVALPDRLSFEQGAGVPFNYQTALLALEIRARLKAGEMVLTTE